MLPLIGYASGLAGADPHVAEGPLMLQQSAYLTFPFQWETLVTPPPTISTHLDEAVRAMCKPLAKKVAELVSAQKSFIVLGGDNTSSIGTWSGAYEALHQQGDMGLLWIDAHMDSHTPETSESGRIHGMPLACLLGYGYPSLTTLLQETPKFKPEHICLLGTRSFERGEAALLEQLKVRIYYMDEIKQRGWMTVLQEAITKVSLNTLGYGLMIDIDAVDPEEAPGVDVPAPDGIRAEDLYNGIVHITNDPNWLGAEIVEFDPAKDIAHKTEKLILSYMELMARNNRI
jgi:arginase